MKTQLLAPIPVQPEYDPEDDSFTFTAEVKSGSGVSQTLRIDDVTGSLERVARARMEANE